MPNKEIKDKTFEELSVEDMPAVQVVFVPGCFDSFDGTQQELDEMMAEIHRLVASGEILEKSRLVDIDAMTPAELAEAMGIDLDESSDSESVPKRTLQ